MGQVDAFCLACERHLRDEPSAAAHAREPAHAANLRAVGYFDKYKDDCIRKVKGGYFCGMCNAVLGTAARVGLHVREPAHGAARGALLLRRAGGAAGAGGGVLARGAVLLPRAAWHGLVGDACLLCNAEFLAEDAHTADHKHLLNLVQSTALFGPGNSVYRKIDETSCHCLTCNNVFDAASFDEHFDSADHKTALKQCEVAGENHNDDVPDVTDTSDDHEHNGEIKTSIGNKQNAVKEETHKKHEVKGVDLDDVYCKALGAKNYIIKLDGDMGLFCILCHTGLNDKESIPQHLNSKHHQTMFELHRERVKNNTDTKKDTVIVCKSKKDSGDATKSQADTEEATKTLKNTEEVTKTNKDIKKAAKSKKESAHPNDNAQDIDSNNTENRSQILESVSAFQKHEVNINFINDSAFCKKCTMNIDFDFKAINEHIDGHKKTTNKNEDKKVPFEHGVQANGENKNLFTKPVFKTQNGDHVSTTSVEDIRAVAKKNGMIFNGRELHCTMCDLIVPASVKNIEEHISGSKHKAKMSQVVVKQTPKKKITKQRLEEFIKDATMIEDEGAKEIVINEKFSLSFFNFMFLGKTLSGLACIVCNMQLSNLGMLINHVNDPRHKKMFEECDVITSLDSEFVREVTPGKYHCGFCNDVSDDWDDLEEHLKSSDHQRSKIRAEWRLQENMNDIRVHKVRKQMQFEMFARMAMSNPFMPNMFMPNMFNFNRDSDSD